jgi:hypothetical protein
MKKILFFCSLIFVQAAPSFAGSRGMEDVFTVSCEINLIGGGDKVTDQKISEPATAPSGPTVYFDLGDYRLQGHVSYARSPGDSDYGPQMEMTLYKLRSGPIAGIVNLAIASDLGDVQVGEESTISSLSFLSLRYEGRSYTRIDYSCTLTRVK